MELVQTMVARVQRLDMQCGFRMRAICRALDVFRRPTPKPTNAQNLQRFIEQL
jgi:hypothetical protein